MVAKTQIPELENQVLQLGSEELRRPFETVVKNCPGGSFEVLDERGEVCAYLIRPLQADRRLVEQIEAIWRDNPEELRRRQRECRTGRTTAEVIARLRALEESSGEHECPSP